MNREEWAFVAKVKKVERMKRDVARLESELAAEGSRLGKARGLYGLRPLGLMRELLR